MKHKLTHFAECSLFNSEHAYADGYYRAICACGWKSAVSRDHKALVALWELHAKGLG